MTADGSEPGSVSQTMGEVIMAYQTQVEFRGEFRDVVVDKNSYEEDPDCHEIDWHFEGLTPEQHDELKLTAEEEQEIFEALIETGD